MCDTSDWYLAAEGVFVGALVLLLSALIIESLFACCQLCLRRSLIPSTVASLAVAAGNTALLTKFVALIIPKVLRHKR